MTEKSRSDSGRIPPQDITAEKSLLGAILLSDASFPEVLEHLKYEDFYDKNHALIFKAMSALYEKHKPIDLLTLCAEMKAEKTLKTVGGEKFLSLLTNFVPTASHIDAYTELVEKTAVRRRLIKAGTEIAEKAYEDDVEISELVGRAEKDLFEVSDKSTKNEYSGMEELLVDAFDRMEELQKNKGALRGLKTGYPDIDKLTAGFQKGDLIIIGARPAMGKTTLALDLAYNVADINKKGVLFFSMEMAKNELMDRLISFTSRVKAWNIRTGNISDQEYEQIGNAMGEIGEVPLFIDDSGAMNILEVRNKARRFAHEHELGMIIIDYLQLLQGTDRYAGNRVQEVTEISRGLKTLARELEIPVVALAQLSRNVTGRDDPRPVLSDLRESGSIEQDADLVTFLHRPDYYNEGKEGYEPTNLTKLIIAKHRHGGLGTIDLFFDKEHVHFMSVDSTHPDE
ncbi:replicative DNA helicase [Candidatus Saccharibacteria bacterium]|nr:replicative DNA helicase [Candidatus Saccharibacteria bacterium]